MELHCEDVIKELKFNARNLHFASVYGHPRELIFEPQIMGLLELLMRDDDVYYDVGANWGMEVLHAALLPKWSGEIHAFEPVPDTFSDLLSLVTQASLDYRITCHNIALSDHSGIKTMMYADGIQSGTATIIDLDQENTGIKVRTEKLDDMGLSAPTFMKLDVEGHEAVVFSGSKNLIARHKPFIIFESWHTPNDYQNSAEAFKLLEDMEYVFFRPAWRRGESIDDSVWPHSQPPSYTENRFLTLIPMDKQLRAFMAEHIDIFACHKNRLNDLRLRLDRNP